MSRTLLRIWLTASLAWILAIAIGIYAGGIFPASYDASFPLRPGLEAWQKDWPASGPLRHPLYEIIRSPSAERLPLTFQWRGYAREPWSNHINDRMMPSSRFPGGETLDLPEELTAADRDYIKQVFWQQRWSRWKDSMGSAAVAAVAVPLAGLVVLALLSAWKQRATGEPIAPDLPRLTEVQANARLRRTTLAVSLAAFALWIVVGVLNNREEPQALSDIIAVMFIAMLPTNLAIVMSLLRRGPRTAACLAGAGWLMLLPQVAAHIGLLS